MLHIHQGNQLEVLTDAMIGQMRQSPPASVLAPIEIVLPEQSLGDWLRTRIASRTGICANINFQLPAGFIWSILRRCLPGMPEESSYTPDVLSWRLYDVLSDQPKWSDEPALKAYLDQASSGEVWELAHQLAYLFDRYLVYRPEWISDWEKGEINHWQGRLWHAISQGEGLHWVAQQQHLLQALSSADLPDLPEHIYLFAIYSLSPGYLSLIDAMARRTEVHVYLLNPSEEYWGLIKTRRDIVRKQASGQEVVYDETGHPLLASMGKVAQQFVESLLSFDAEVDDYFVPPEGESLLAVLQRDIYQMHNSLLPGSLTALSSDDSSVQVHSCHSAQREVEVLHNSLLSQLEQQPDMSWEDVVIACVDIDKYGPYIQAVFDRAEPKIPFSILDQHTGSGVRAIQSIVDILSVITGRFELSNVLSLLDLPAVRARFELTEDDVERLESWFTQAGIKWGLSAEHKAEFSLPETAQNTWEQGLSRLMLGAVMALDEGDDLNGIYPLQCFEGLESIVFGRFVNFYDKLLSFRQRVKKTANADYWVQTIWSLLSEFYDRDKHADELGSLRSMLDAWVSHIQRAQMSRDFEFDIVKTSLTRYVAMANQKQYSFATGVRFMPLSAAAFQPAKMLCVLGMNGQAYPRLDRISDLDLMLQEPRAGDYSLRHEDRYLFLQCLLNARNTLYISYTGKSIRDNAEQPPSLLVDEILELVASALSVPIDKLPAGIRQHHPLQAFDQRYFSAGKDNALFSYSQEMYAIAQVGARELPPAQLQLEEVFTPSMDITIEDFLKFFAHPAKYYISQVLKARLPYSSQLEEDHETFSLTSLDAWRVRTALVESGLGQRGLANVALETMPVIPHGNIGLTVGTIEKQIVNTLLQRFEKLTLSQNPLLEELEVGLGNCTLRGQLKLLPDGRQVLLRTGKVRAEHMLNAWIQHLLGCIHTASAGKMETCLVGLDKTIRFQYVQDAGDILKTLLDIYLQGQYKPVPLLHNTAMAYVEAKGSLPAALKVWSETDMFPECDSDLSYQLLWPDYPLDEEFESLAKQAFQPLLDYREVSL